MAKLFMVGSLREEGAKRPEARFADVGRSMFKVAPASAPLPLHYIETCPKTLKVKSP